MDEYEAIITYCKAARRAKSLGLCKLLIKEEIQPRVERLQEDIKRERQCSVKACRGTYKT